ncbi:MAG: hypothetical protein C0595_03635 [Marinilabiliales bacterium]|nr:MAG: hypothetical protein C0595_03635 [Marinilabiliales bacterium]
MVVESSFGDYIYILIGLLWVGFSIYKGAQKNKKSQQSESENNRTPNAIEDLLGEFLGYKQDEAVYTSEKSDSEPTTDMYSEEIKSTPETKNVASNIFSYDDEYEEEGNFFEEKKVYTTEEDNKLENSVVKKEKKPLRRLKKPRINIKKAIIYSAILNRPSY